VEKIELLLDGILMPMGRLGLPIKVLLLLCRLLLLLLDDDVSRGRSGSGAGRRSGGAGAGRACPPHFAQPHGDGAQHPQFGG
jgi:hypothetical protein